MNLKFLTKYGRDLNMKKIKEILNNNFWFGIALCGTICLCLWGFKYARAHREVDVLGSEVFTIALPLWISYVKVQMLECTLTKMKNLLNRI